MIVHVNAVINAIHIHADAAHYVIAVLVFAVQYVIVAHAHVVLELLYVVLHVIRLVNLHVAHQGELYAIRPVISIANYE
jgi:hypothetical protein